MAVNLFRESIEFVSHNETTTNPFSKCFVLYSVGNHKESTTYSCRQNKRITQPLCNPMQSNSNYTRVYVYMKRIVPVKLRMGLKKKRKKKKI